MDLLSIVIILIATLSAILFKLFLFKRIRHWMDQDLIKGLADQDPAKQRYLHEHHQQLLQDKTPRKQIHRKLTEAAQNYPNH